MKLKNKHKNKQKNHLNSFPTYSISDTQIYFLYTKAHDVSLNLFKVKHFFQIWFSYFIGSLKEHSTAYFA